MRGVRGDPQFLGHLVWFEPVAQVQVEQAGVPFAEGRGRGPDEVALLGAGVGGLRGLVVGALEVAVVSGRHGTPLPLEPVQ